MLGYARTNESPGPGSKRCSAIPTADENAKPMRELLESRLADYRANAASADALLKTGIAPVPPMLDKAELAAWTHVARVLLNLHETITRS